MIMMEQNLEKFVNEVCGVVTESKVLVRNKYIRTGIPTLGGSSHSKEAGQEYTTEINIDHNNYNVRKIIFDGHCPVIVGDVIRAYVFGAREETEEDIKKKNSKEPGYFARISYLQSKNDITDGEKNELQRLKTRMKKRMEKSRDELMQRIDSKLKNYTSHRGFLAHNDAATQKIYVPRELKSEENAFKIDKLASDCKVPSEAKIEITYVNKDLESAICRK